MIPTSIVQEVGRMEDSVSMVGLHF